MKKFCVFGKRPLDVRLVCNSELPVYCFKGASSMKEKKDSHNWTSLVSLFYSSSYLLEPSSSLISYQFNRTSHYTRFGGKD